MYVLVHVYTYMYVYTYVCMRSLYILYYRVPGSIRTNISNIEFVYLFECTFMYSTQTLTTVP